MILQQFMGQLIWSIQEKKYQRDPASGEVKGKDWCPKLTSDATEACPPAFTYINVCTCTYRKVRAREVTPWYWVRYRALIAVTEGLSFIPSTYLMTTNCISCRRGSNTLFCHSWAPEIHMVHICTFRQNTHASKMKMCQLHRFTNVQKYNCISENSAFQINIQGWPLFKNIDDLLPRHSISESWGLALSYFSLLARPRTTHSFHSQCEQDPREENQTIWEMFKNPHVLWLMAVFSQWKIICLCEKQKKAVYIAQWIRGYSGFTEGTGSIPGTHTVSYIHLLLQFQGIQHPFLASKDKRHASNALTNRQETTQYIK